MFGNLQPVQLAQVYFPPIVRVHMWGKKMGAGQFWEDVSRNINEMMWGVSIAEMRKRKK